MSFSRPSTWELRAAEAFLEQVPGADMVKFAKNGSDATTAAVKLARAATGRPLVGRLPDPAVLLHRRLVHRHDGHARRASRTSSAQLTVGFDYNDLDSVESLLDRAPRRGRLPGPGGGHRDRPSRSRASSRACGAWPTATGSSSSSTR